MKFSGRTIETNTFLQIFGRVAFIKLKVNNHNDNLPFAKGPTSNLLANISIMTSQ